MFSGWNGVCAKTQTTCTFPVGPITSIRAIFDHDTSPPSSPGGLTDDLRDPDGHPDQLDGVDATTWPSPAIGSIWTTRLPATRRARRSPSPTCSAVTSTRSRSTLSDEVGNRSPRASITAPDAVVSARGRVASVGIDRRRAHAALRRQVAREQRRPRLVLTLMRGADRRGARPLRRQAGHATTCGLTIPQTLTGGSYRLRITVVNPDGGIARSVRSRDPAAEAEVTEEGGRAARRRRRAKARWSFAGPSVGQASALVGLIGGVVALVFIFKPGWKPQAPSDASKATISDIRVFQPVTFKRYLQRQQLPIRRGLSHAYLDRTGGDGQSSTTRSSGCATRSCRCAGSSRTPPRTISSRRRTARTR